MHRLWFLLGFSWLLAAQTPALSIGVIQGAAAESPYLNRFVNFRGVVVGRYEDRNTRGDVYYTLFVQSLPAESDGDPATSDAIAVFLGRQPRPDVALGDVVAVGGKVTEFYDLTEIDDRGLTVTAESHAPLPAPVALAPPADLAAAALYFEALEGMRVALDDAVVAGPTHEGCGFAVAPAAVALPIPRHADDDPTGQAVPVLTPSDLACPDIPQLRTGDGLRGVAGALTYSFDQFKIVLDGVDGLTITPATVSPPATAPIAAGQQISVATLNAEDFFDTTLDTADVDEPVLTAAELAARQAKLAQLIAGGLRCPTLLALQEVEHEALLRDLAVALAGPCGFTYQVSHRESPDARGIDNALLSDPRRVRVRAASLRPVCSPVPTGLRDPALACPPGEEPLFGRPPLQVEVTIDGQPAVIYVNHFKSKRDGEIDTDLQRIRQAVYLNELAGERLAADAGARLIALGDFNDTELSPTLLLLTDPAQGGHFRNALSAIPAAERYSYNFGGVSELIDGVLLSPALAEEVSAALILHVDSDYPAGLRLDTSPGGRPWRSSDHDPALVLLGQAPATPTPVPTAAPSPTAAASAAPPTPRPTTAPPATAAAATALPATAATATPTPVVVPTAPATGRGAALAVGAAAVGLLAAGALLARRRAGG